MSIDHALMEDRYEDIVKVILSPEWKHFVEVIQNRRQQLQLQINEAVREGKAGEAMGKVFAMDELQLLLDQFIREKNYLGQQVKKGEQ